MAYRYDLLDADLVARLKKGDQESWLATMNELRIARFMEELYGSGCLHWHPQGRKQKVGEFELALTQLDIYIFVEVKTVFPRDLERMEHRIEERLFRYAAQVPIPALLSVRIEAPGTYESFSGKKFKNHLLKELSEINPHDLAQGIRLTDYIDTSTGLHLKIETLEITPEKEEKNAHIGMIGGGVKTVVNEVYIKHSLHKAYEQLPSGERLCLVVICPSTAFPIDEDDMSIALFGSLAVTVYQKKGEPVKAPKVHRMPDGFFQPRRNRKVSAVGLYKGQNEEKYLEIYHNPFTTNPITHSAFIEKKGVRQLVMASNTEMKWSE
ncbi:hypothetical protein ACFLWZ_01365 [Chloroflexota bacterium]